VGHHSEAFIGIDTSKSRNAVAIAEGYRYPPRVGRDKQPKVAAAPRRVREIAWNAQNEAVRTLPVTCAQRQAANDRRYGDCPRAVGIHLGDQSRDHGKSAGIKVARDCGPLESWECSTGPQPSVATRIKGKSRRQ
jgi:hypothetical protein